MKLILTTATVALLAASTLPASAFDIHLPDDHDVTTTSTVPTTQTHVSYSKGNRDHEPYYSAREAFLHPRSISDLAGPATRKVTVTHGTKTVSTTVTCHTVIHFGRGGISSSQVCS